MISLVVIEPPKLKPISLDEAKVHLRVDHDDEDSKIELLIDTAVASLDGPDGWLGRCLINQTLELRLNGFSHEREGILCDAISLPCPPLLDAATVNVEYTAMDGNNQSVAPADFRVIRAGSNSKAMIVPAYGKSWPRARCELEAVRIRYQAGYGATSADVPAPIRSAMLLHIGHLYENRQEVYVDATRVTAIELPRGIQDLLDPQYRIFA